MIDPVDYGGFLVDVSVDDVYACEAMCELGSRSTHVAPPSAGYEGGHYWEMDLSSISVYFCYDGPSDFDAGDWSMLTVRIWQLW